MRLKQYMELKGFTAKKAAEFFGVSPSTIYFWTTKLQHRKMMPTPQHLKMIAEKTNNAVTAIDFVEWYNHTTDDTK